ncbi:hypothetical protein [Methylobacterium sp. CM6246]
MLQLQRRPKELAYDRSTRFNLPARLLHWSMAVLNLAMLLIGVAMVTALADYHVLAALHRRSAHRAMPEHLTRASGARRTCPSARSRRPGGPRVITVTIGSTSDMIV